MSSKVRVLYSARDPGGVGHLLALVEAFRRDPRFELILAASGAALAMLRQAGEAPHAFSLSGEREHLEPGEDPERLLDAATELLAVSRPDAVLVCLSSGGVGIDEALLATAQVPTFAMQDFWGDVNLAMGVPAGVYFVLDEDAVRLTQQRWGVRAVAVGSPKHARYRRLDIVGLRQAARHALGVETDEQVVGFFGQSPAIPGHEAIVHLLIRAVAGLRPRPRLLLREHPKVSTHAATHRVLAERLGLGVSDVTGDGGLERWLAACDLVTTPFSSCGLDHAYLSAYSPEPLGSALYLLCDPKLRAFMRQFSGLERFPIVERGMGQVVGDPTALRPALEEGLSRRQALVYTAACKTLPQDDPSQKIVDFVTQTLEQRPALVHHA